MKKSISKTGITARYAKLHHNIYLKIRKEYEKAILENAILMTEGDEKLLLVIANEYTKFIHEEKYTKENININIDRFREIEENS